MFLAHNGHFAILRADFTHGGFESLGPPRADDAVALRGQCLAVASLMPLPTLVRRMFGVVVMILGPLDPMF